MTYKEYKNKRQKEANELPIFFAFSNYQFEKCMKERGLTTNSEDLKKIVRVTNGGFCLRTDLPKLEAFANSDNLKELMKNKNFAREAFEYEMHNHEYVINWQGDWDVCECFGDCQYEEYKTYKEYLTEEGYGEETIEAFKEALREYNKSFKY